MNRPRHGIGRRALSWPITLLAYFIFSLVLAAPAEGAAICEVDPTGTYIEAENFTDTIFQ